MTTGRSMRVHAAGARSVSAKGSLRIRAGGRVSAPRPTVPADTFGRSMVIRIPGERHIYIAGASWGPTFEGVPVGTGTTTGAFLSALSLDGTVLWTRTWTGGASGWGAQAIAADASGIYVSTGLWPAAPTWDLRKYSHSGTLLWGPFTYGGTVHSLFPTRIEVADGRVIVVANGRLQVVVAETGTGTAVVNELGVDYDSIIIYDATGTAAKATGDVVHTAYEVHAAPRRVQIDTVADGGATDTTDYAIGAMDYCEAFAFTLGPRRDLFGLWKENRTWETSPSGHYVRSYAIDRYTDALDYQDTIVDLGTMPFASLSGRPWVDPLTGMIITNVWDSTGGQPTLSAFDADGTLLWTVDDGTYIIDDVAWAGTIWTDPKGDGIVPFASMNYDLYLPVLQILDVADGTRTIGPLTYGTDSTAGAVILSIAVA